MTTTPHLPLHLNLDDTTSCPAAPACEACSAHDALACVTIECPVGVLCLTLCPQCRASRRIPAWTGPACATRVGEHCAHLGISRDDMSLTLAHEGLDGRYYWLPA